VFCLPAHHPENSVKPEIPESPPVKELHWTDRWRTSVPTRNTLAAHPWLKPIANHVLDPKLWRMHHESVARGAAIGVFWAFTLPVAQILVAAAHCVWWRGNIPVAAAVTLITNPLTIGFWLWLAYLLGSLVLDAPPPLPLGQIGEGAGIMTYITSIGAPAILGMGIFAVGGSLAAYALIKIVWRLQFLFKHKNRLTRHKKTAASRKPKNHD
jgi:uncharacterized protein (DUF2062 family)